MKRRILSLAMALIMVVMLLPHSATFATELQQLNLEDGDIEINSPGDYLITQSDPTKWVSKSILVDVSGIVNITLSGIKTDTDYMSNPKNPIQNTISIKDINCNVELEAVKINASTQSGTSALNIRNSSVNLTLTGENVLSGGENAAGIQCPADSHLTITGPGSLVTTGGSSGAGIGGGNGKPSVTPKNSAGDEVFLVKWDTLSDMEKGYLSAIGYNTDGIIGIGGKYYFYLPYYTITYKNTEGATNKNVPTYHVLSTVVLNAASKGFDVVFEGWFDAETGGNQITSIGPGSIGDKTLYARWSDITSINLPSITTTTLPDGMMNTFYSLILEASGDTPITWSIESGTLPVLSFFDPQLNI